jgi:hypothetical protein
MSTTDKGVFRIRCFPELNKILDIGRVAANVGIKSNGSIICEKRTNTGIIEGLRHLRYFNLGRVL